MVYCPICLHLFYLKNNFTTVVHTQNWGNPKSNHRNENNILNNLDTLISGFYFKIIIIIEMRMQSFLSSVALVGSMILSARITLISVYCSISPEEERSHDGWCGVYLCPAFALSIINDGSIILNLIIPICIAKTSCILELLTSTRRKLPLDNFCKQLEMWIIIFCLNCKMIKSNKLTPFTADNLH